MRRRRCRQLALRLARIGWGGARDGAGRPKDPAAGVSHRSRPAHDGRCPVHVSVRVRRDRAHLRSDAVFPAVRAALSMASGQARFRVVEFSVQRDHLHLLVEADDRGALSRGMQGLVVRVARAVNRVMGARGRVVADRYHARELTSPRAVRNALVYVLHNGRKHRATRAWIDPCSSAPWFDGFVEDDVVSFDPTHAARPPPTPPSAEHAQRPNAKARTWLLSIGWQRHGRIALHDAPRA